MARKIPLKTTVLTLIKDDRTGADLPFDWAEQMQIILRSGPQTGLNFEDVVRSVEAMMPIAKAAEDKADCVVLTDDQYRTLRTRFEAFAFRFADPALVEFGMAVKNAEEVLPASPKAKAA